MLSILNTFLQKNDVILGIKNNHLDYILIEAPDYLQKKSPFLFDEISTSLTRQEKQKISDRVVSGDDHESRFIDIELKSENLIIVFQNNSEKKLKSILIGMKNEKK